MELIWYLLGGMVVILEIAAFAWIIALVAGLIIALIGRSPVPGVKLCVSVVTAVLRGTPELLLIYIIFYGLSGVASIRLGPVTAVSAALGIVYAAFAAEIYRAGFLTVPRGQLQAAMSIGLTSSKAMRLVILPQAARFMIVPLANLLLGLSKVATYASVVGVAEIVYRATGWMERTGDVTEPSLAMAGIYIVITIPIAWSLRRLERRWRRNVAVAATR